jgi:hypothetical protein
VLVRAHVRHALAQFGRYISETVAHLCGLGQRKPPCLR